MTLSPAKYKQYWLSVSSQIQESLALASMVRDDLPASSTPNGCAVSSKATSMRSKVVLEFET